MAFSAGKYTCPDCGGRMEGDLWDDGVTTWQCVGPPPCGSSRLPNETPPPVSARTRAHRRTRPRRGSAKQAHVAAPVALPQTRPRAMPEQPLVLPPAPQAGRRGLRLVILAIGAGAIVVVIWLVR